MPTASHTAAHVARAMEYAQNPGNVSKWVRLACERHLRDLERFKAKSAPFYFDPEAAETVCNVVEHFPHIKGIWAQHRKHIELEPWQCFILASVFGWKCRATDTRRFRVAYTEIPRKNAKSTLTSAIGLYLLACDGEQGAHVVSAANTRDQAKLVFTDAQLMARRESGYRARFGVEVLAHVIAAPLTASKFEAISAEHSNLDGLNIHGALIDELHAHPTRGVWDVLETATGSRAQPLIWAITTAGVNRATVCYDQRTHVTQILEGIVEDESYFGIIYTIDPDDDPWTEESWVKANPNYGISIYPEQLRTMAARAQSMPSAQNSFLTKHLNVWVNADTAWLNMTAWERCRDAELNLEDFEGEPCYVGIDLALRSDIAALVLLYPPRGSRDFYAVFGRYYLPEETINKEGNAHYQGWEMSGLLTGTPGSITDFDYILDNLMDFSERFDVREIASDPYKNVPIVTALQKRGVTVPIVDVRQSGPNMSPAMVEMEGLVTAGRLHHDGDPILAWMVSNVVAHRAGQDLMQPRKEAEEKKIDGVTALLMALNRAMRHGAEARADYENRGLWSI